MKIKEGGRLVFNRDKYIWGLPLSFNILGCILLIHEFWICNLKWFDLMRVQSWWEMFTCKILELLTLLVEDFITHYKIQMCHHLTRH